NLTGSLSTTGFGPVKTAGSIVVAAAGDINATASTINTSGTGSAMGGTVVLNSFNNINAANINTTSQGLFAAGGDIVVTASGNVNLGTLDASASGFGSGGTITATSRAGSVTVGNLSSSSSGENIVGGRILLNAFGRVMVSGDINAPGFNGATGGAVTAGSVTTDGPISRNIKLSAARSHIGADGGCFFPLSPPRARSL